MSQTTPRRTPEELVDLAIKEVTDPNSLTWDLADDSDEDSGDYQEHTPVDGLDALEVVANAADGTLGELLKTLLRVAGDSAQELRDTIEYWQNEYYVAQKLAVELEKTKRALVNALIAARDEAEGNNAYADDVWERIYSIVPIDQEDDETFYTYLEQIQEDSKQRNIEQADTFTTYRTLTDAAGYTSYPTKLTAAHWQTLLETIRNLRAAALATNSTGTTTPLDVTK